MILTVGNKVVYPCQGPCLINSIVEKVVAGVPKSFYQLSLLDERGGELFVPVDRVQAMGIRLLLKKSEIPKLLNKLKMKAEIAKTGNSQQRQHKAAAASSLVLTCPHGPAPGIDHLF
jgi:RNA polymerase-interacting CarD/CdnL/TRCF family regulator